MKNKLMLSLLTILSLSCRQTKMMNNHEDNFIVGKWGVYETVEFQDNDDSATSKCNVCPEIEFAKDHSGIIKTVNTPVHHFNWQIDRGELVIKYSGNNDTANEIVSDGNYKIIYTDKKLTHEISLTDTAKNIKYMLRK